MKLFTSRGMKKLRFGLNCFHLIILVKVSEYCVAQIEGGDSSSPFTTQNMQAIKDKIFKDYDRTIRPTLPDSNVTEVYITFIPIFINDVDEEKGLFVFDSVVWMSWMDPRLQWNDSSYDHHLQLHKDMVWVPDISVLNSHSANVDPTYDVPLQLYPYGYLYWLPKMKTITTCSTLLQTNYPSDILECTIVLGSWNIDGWTVAPYQGHGIYFDHFENIHQRWELIISEVEMTNKTWYFDCCFEPYVSLNYRLPLKRRPLKEIEATRIPCILIMALTLAVYWFPCESNMKCILSSILFTALSILLIYVATSTRNPLAVLHGVSFLRTTMYIGIITALLQIFIVLKIASCKGPSYPPIPVTEVLTGPMGKYLLLRSPFSEDKIILDQVKLNEDFTTTEKVSVGDKWILVATAFDRIFFLITLVVTISVHHL